MNNLVMYGAAALASCFSAALMTYVSLVTPVGPWIEPILVIATIMMLYGARFKGWYQELLACVAAASGVAGIAAIACSFSYPTLFFLDAAVFNQWLEAPLSFIGTLALLVITTGGIAFGLVAFWEEGLLKRDDLSFPLADIVDKLICAHYSLRKGLGLCGGFIISGLLSLLIPLGQSVTLVKGCSLGPLTIPQLFISVNYLPLLSALGFITNLSAYALVIGLVTKIFLVAPVAAVTGTSSELLVRGWCSGMMLFGLFEGVRKIVPSMYKRVSRMHLKRPSWTNPLAQNRQGFTGWIVVVLMSMFASSALLLRSMGFSWMSLLYLWVFTGLSTYQLVLIAGAVGLAPLGRFALFVTVPGLILFKYNALQSTCVATFVELCGGIAADLMFGRKLATRAKISRARIIQVQAIGLIVGAVVIGGMLWFLSTTMKIGQPPLLAQRACTRAMLLRAYDFSLWGTVLGALFSFLLHRIKINGALVMSGLLMPFEYVFPLAVGGLLSSMITKREEHYYWSSGIFVASSVILLGKLLATRS